MKNKVGLPNVVNSSALTSPVGCGCWSNSAGTVHPQLAK